MPRDLIIDRASLETWAGRTLTDSEVARIAECVHNSSIPDAIGVIANEAIVRYQWNDHTNEDGAWCRHSEEPVTPEAEPTDDGAAESLSRCPASCRTSRPVRAGDDGDDSADGHEETQDEDGSVCDECEELIPDVGSGGLANRHHKPSCSLYDPEED